MNLSAHENIQNAPQAKEQALPSLTPIGLMEETSITTSLLQLEGTLRTPCVDLQDTMFRDSKQTCGNAYTETCSRHGLCIQSFLVCFITYEIRASIVPSTTGDGTSQLPHYSSTLPYDITLQREQAH